MSKYFLTESNYRLLNRLVHNQYGNINYTDDLINVIEYVFTNVHPDPPDNMKVEDYVYLMNKKVINLLEPILTKKLIKHKEKNNKQKSNPLKPIEMGKKNLDNNSINHVFDSSKTMHTKYNNQTIERPRPHGMGRSTDEINNNLEKLKNTRDELNPKKQDVNFALNNNNDKLERADILYSNTLKQRELQQQSFTNEQQRFKSFDELNNDQNNTIDMLANMKNQQQMNAPSIGDVLKNQKSRNQPINQIPFKKSTPIIRESVIRKPVQKSTPIVRESVIRKPVQKSTPIVRESVIRKPVQKSTPIIINHETMNHETMNHEIPLTKKDYYITIDSIDRDLSLYPSPFNFQINFLPIYQQTNIPSKRDDSGNIIIESKTITRNNNKTEMSRYSNISEIECISVNIPSDIKNSQYLFDNKTCPSNIISFPYILLNIDQLKGPYNGTNEYLSNAFAKLIPKAIVSNNSYFIELVPSGDHEIYRFAYNKLGMLDKLNLQLTKKRGGEYNLGEDKLYIIEVNKSEYNSDNLMINVIGDEHNLMTGDLIYFYNMMPNINDVIYFNKSIELEKTGYLPKSKNNNKRHVYLTLKIKDSIIDFTKILNDFNSDMYLFISYNYKKTRKNELCKIIDINEESIIIEKPKNYTASIDINRIGYAKNNVKGVQNDERTSLFNKDGYRILSVDRGITINFPSKYAPKHSNIFLIQEKMQTSFTFRISTMTSNK